MADPVSASVVRRRGLLALIIAGACMVLVGAFILLWLKLPTWAPAWVVDHSPWVDPIVRAVAAEAGQWERASERMGGWGRSVVPAMIDRLDDESRDVRHMVAMTLAEIQDDRSVTPLVERMRVEAQGTENYMLAYAFQQALLRQDPSLVATAMLPLPMTHDESVAIVIVLAGKIHDDRLVPALRRIVWEPEPAVRTGKAPDQLTLFGGRGALAASALAHSPCPSAMSALMPAFTDSDPIVRRRAVSGIMLHSQRKIIPLLAEAVRRSITDDDQQVRRIAATTAAIVEIPDVEDSLLAMSQREDPADRTAAIRGLGAKWASARAIDRLTECLAYPDAKVQLAVVRSLGRIKNPAVVTPLLSALSLADDKVRKEACSTLQWKPLRDDPRVFPALLHAIDDPNHAVSEEAERVVPASTDEQRVQVEEAVRRRKERLSAAGASASGSTPPP